ncbi:hypothetical protein SUGI_0432480 [Cryptomeria japonica]|nr:hypothetical protein SUGI_0432480 [Cryptomeria japonica]
MENRVTSPSIFQLETMELKRMVKESGGGITEESPIPKPQISNVPIATPSSFRPKLNPNNSSVVVAMPSSPKSIRKKNKDYLQRGQWLRAAGLGVNEGVVSTVWLMIGTGAEKSCVKPCWRRRWRLWRRGHLAWLLANSFLLKRSTTWN